MKIRKVVGTKVTVREHETGDRKTSSGLYMPSTVSDEFVVGEIVHLDERGRLIDERYVGSVFSVGDSVVFKSDASYQGALKLDTDEGVLYITDANNLLAVVE